MLILLHCSLLAQALALLALIFSMGLSTWLYFPTWAAFISHTGLHARSLESAEQETGRTKIEKADKLRQMSVPIYHTLSQNQGLKKDLLLEHLQEWSGKV